MNDPLIGRLVGERFLVQSRIGEGGMGAVYAAEDKGGGGRVAVKFLHRQYLANADFVARFRQEAKAASRFRHESVVRILASGDDEDGVPFIAMEYCPGRSLKAILAEDPPLSVARACSIAVQILGALGEAHKNGIVHRDLKPENIRIETTSEGVDKVKILDFGVAKFIGTESGDEMAGAVKTKTGLVFGTPKYMAPEQILGEAVDGRSDIYSAGSILYEMLTGTPPFVSDDIIGFVTKHVKEPVEPPTRRAPDRRIPRGVEQVVLEMLEKNRVARPARADEVAESLEPFRTYRARGTGGRLAAKEGASRLYTLLYLAGGVLGAAGSFGVAEAFGLGGGVAVAGAVAAAGLGVGAVLAFAVFPRVGEAAFWLRVLMVALCLGAATGISVAAGGTRSLFPVAIGLGALLVFVFFSMGWGVGRRLVAFGLGGVAAPVLAAGLLPVPASGRFLWLLGAPFLAAAGTGLLLVAIGIGFALSGFVAPPLRSVGEAGGVGRTGE